MKFEMDLPDDLYKCTIAVKANPEVFAMYMRIACYPLSVQWRCYLKSQVGTILERPSQFPYSAIGLNRRVVNSK